MRWLLLVLASIVGGVTGGRGLYKGSCHVLTPQLQPFECHAAAFGAFLPAHGRQLRLCLVDDDKTSGMTGCSATPTESYSGCVVIVRRGQCPFQQKLAVVAAAGAEGMIVVNSEDISLELAALDYRVIDAFAVSTTRSDGDNLIHLIAQMTLSSRESVAIATIESSIPHFDQALLRIEYLISVNTPAVAFETFYAVLPADLKNVDAQLQRIVISKDVGPIEGASEIAKFLQKCTVAFLNSAHYASDVTFHAAVGLSSLMATHGPSVIPVEQQASVASSAMVQLLGRGYFSHAMALHKKVFSEAPSPAMRCFNSFLKFILGDVVSALQATSDCSFRESQFNVTAGGLDIPHSNFLHLVALKTTAADRHCLETLSQEPTTLSATTPTDCCRRQLVYNRHEHPIETNQATDRIALRETHWFSSKFVKELFHTLTIMGVFFDEQGAFPQSLTFFGLAAKLCEEWSPSFEVRQALAVPVVFDSTKHMEFFMDELEGNIENVRRVGERKARVLSSLTGATSYRHSFEHPENAVYLRYTITPPTMFVGYQGHDTLFLQHNIFALRAEMYPSLNSRFQPLNSLLQPGKVPRLRRIAFVSTWFRRHSVGKLILGIIQRLDRSKFHVMVYRAVHFLKSPDELTTEFHRMADSYMELPVSQEDAVALLRHEAIDVLVFPELGMDAWTLLLAHHRVAPIQCVFWGHPITTGNPAIDYFMNSEYFTFDFFETTIPPTPTQSSPSGQAVATWPGKYHGSSFSEQVVLFRGLSTFFVSKDITEHTFQHPILHLPATARLYVCPQTLMKLHTHFDMALHGILQQDLLARIVLLSSPTQRIWTEQLRRRFRRRFGEAHRRVVFMSTLPYNDFMGLLSTADVVLDPFPFGGGVTTLDALAVGSPVVTLPAAQTVPQLAAGFLRYIGVTDTIASSVDEYIALSVQIAHNAALRRTLRARILAQHWRLYEDEATVEDWNAFLAAVDVDAAAP